MNGWIEGIHSALEYIEENLTEELRIEDIAERAHVSAFHFQRIFGVLCGFSVGEYIRSRRLALAAEELCATDARIIDIALKYGYDSPESFTRAFAKFHGAAPSHVREKGAPLRAYPRLRLRLTLEGGTAMEYRITEKAAFTVMGVSRRFSAETADREIPAFWDEHLRSPLAQVISGRYGLCLDGKSTDFEYIIADDMPAGQEPPQGCVVRTIPAGTWAVFPVYGEIPEALQQVSARIWNEWLPNSAAFRLAGDYDVEYYPSAPDAPCEIWIPVERNMVFRSASKRCIY